MNKYFIIITATLLLTTNVYARFGGKFGFYATMNGSIDFVKFEKPEIDNETHSGTGFGLEVSPGMRFGSSVAFGPFAMFSSISDSDDDDTSYLLSGYGGELKIRFSPLNFKGGYGFYSLKETIDEVETNYTEASGWHAAAGFEALLGPGITLYIDGKYRFINFAKNDAEMKTISVVIGVTSYF